MFHTVLIHTRTASASSSPFPYLCLQAICIFFSASSLHLLLRARHLLFRARGCKIRYCASMETPGNSSGKMKATQRANEARSVVPNSQMYEACSPVRMEGCLSAGPNPDAVTPYALLLKNVEQTIKIPLKTILSKGMQTMPAKKVPTFKYVQAGPSCYQVCVELDVTGSRVTVEPFTTIAKVIGDVCSSSADSVESAVLKAFEYLENKHFTRVIDYSTNVVEEYEDKRTWTGLNSCSYVTERVLADWRFSIDSVSKFCSQLEKNEDVQNMYGLRTQAGDRYSETKKFVLYLLNKYIAKHSALDLDFKRFEAQRSSYLKESNDERNAMLMKGYRQAIHFTEKDVLDYVLKFIGLKEAQYNNKPMLESGLFRGEVELWLPEIEEARCGGRTKFKGANLLTAASAEEDAAAKALRYIESKLKITVVDKNYHQRIRAKEKHDVAMKLISNFLQIAEQIKLEWSRMVSYLDDGVAIFGDTLQPFSSATPRDAEVAAVKFCTEGIAAVHADCVRAYEAAAAKISGLEKYNTNAEEYYE